MKPIRLRVEGFTCFRQAVEVDFSEMGLFVITGSTGSGKTSLIDAVVFALYGRTPRAGERSLSGLINLGSRRMTVLLEFSSGSRMYRISRSLRRTRTSVVGDRRLERLAGEEWVPLADKKNAVQAQIKRIVGLDFDGFTRSVVLPQGEFDRFLNGEPKERRSILSDLLRLGKYGHMRSAVHQMAAGLQARARTLKSVVEEQYGDARDKSRKQLERELRKLKRKEQSDSRELDQIRQAEPMALELRHKRSERSRLESASSRAEEILVDRKATRKLAKQTLTEFKKNVERLEKRMGSLGYDRQLHHAILPLVPRLEDVRRLSAQIQAREREIQALSANAKQLEDRIQKAREKKEEAIQSCSAAWDRLQAAATERDRLGRRHGTLEDLRQLLSQWQESRKWRSEKEELASQQAALDLERERTTADLARVRKERAVLENSLSKAEQLLEQLHRLHAAMELRRQLKEGEACPVCGQIAGPLSGEENHPALEDAQVRVSETRTKLHSTGSGVTRLEAQLTGLPKQQKWIDSRLKALNEQIEQVDLALAQSLGKQKKAEKDPGAVLQAVLERASAAHEKVQRYRKEEEGAGAAEQDRRKELEGLRRQAEMVAFQLRSLQEQAAGDQARATQFQKDLSGWDDPEKLRQTLARQESALQKRQVLQQEQKTLLQKIGDAEREVDTAVREVALASADVKRLTRELKTCRQWITKKERELGDKLPRLQRTLMEDEAAQLAGWKQRLKAAHRENWEQLSRRSERLELLKDRIREAKGIRKEIRSLDAQIEVALELHHVLRSDQLIAFIQQEVLDRLAENGTRHLMRLSSERYSFSVAEGDFSVIDHWNADDLRSVATLSGGESFLASVSLALALAESLDFFPTGTETLPLESLFLDEGFSTLDAETLDIVVQGIETLAAGDRMIGVVSHLSELADRFPHRIDMTRSIGGSSVLAR